MGAICSAKESEYEIEKRGKPGSTPRPTTTTVQTRKSWRYSASSIVTANKNTSMALTPTSVRTLCMNKRYPAPNTTTFSDVVLPRFQFHIDQPDGTVRSSTPDSGLTVRINGARSILSVIGRPNHKPGTPNARVVGVNSASSSSSSLYSQAITPFDNPELFVMPPALDLGPSLYAVNTNATRQANGAASASERLNNKLRRRSTQSGGCEGSRVWNISECKNSRYVETEENSSDQTLVSKRQGDRPHTRTSSNSLFFFDEEGEVHLKPLDI